MNTTLTPEIYLQNYRMHILVFLLAFIAALTFAHPTFLLTDEWITGNQLYQLHEGHQAIMNEGKYGVFENGTSYVYFSVRHNYLGYPLFLPIISLPAERLVYFFGDNFIFFIVYLWTILLIGLALFLNGYFPNYTYLCGKRWTPGLIILTFAAFFLNLLYYSPFPLTGTNADPEVMAIVLTNILLFALLAVIIYEILRQIFGNQSFAFLGTVVCLSCSSYFFWTTFCKDHVLVALIFSIILVMIIKFLIQENYWALAGSFFFGGLLIWARPELGVFIWIALCVIILFFLITNRNYSSVYRFRLIVTPLFTILGAIPFFINNYISSKNIFIPSFVLSMNPTLTSVGLIETSSETHQYTLDTINSLLQANQLTMLTPISSFPSDLYGIVFAPLSGSMGVVPIVSVFFMGLLLLPILLKRNENLFDHNEKIIIGTLLLLSFAIFSAYINRVYGLNSDLGIIPDIRYLSPMYLPLVIIGLMIIKKIPGLTENPVHLLTGMSVVWIVMIPLSLVLIRWHYPLQGEWKNVFTSLSHWVTCGIFILSLVFILIYYYSVLGGRLILSKKVIKVFFVFLCTLPLTWQIDASFLTCLHANGLGGYFFWVPVVLKIFNLTL